MYILFLCFWVTGYFILIDEFRTKADTWIAITIILFGFGGLSAFLKEIFQGHYSLLIIWIQMISVSLGMFWASMTLLIYSMHYTNRMPKKLVYRCLVIGLLTIPILILFFVIISNTTFELTDVKNIYHRYILMMTSVVSPYYICSIAFLTINLIDKNKNLWRIEVLTSYILIVPALLLFYVTVFLLPCFGYFNAWKFNIVTITIEFLLFLYLVINKNALGLSFHKTNSTREKVEKAIIQRTRILQHAMKNNIQGILLNLQNVEYTYKINQDEHEIIDDVRKTLEVCRQAQIILDRMSLRDNPIILKIQKCDLLTLIDDTIEFCMKENRNRNVSIEKVISSNILIQIDPVHMHEVIINILNNAIEAVNDDGSGRIVVYLSNYKKYVRLQIKDNGSEIEKKRLKKLNKINEILKTNKDNNMHYGLGLYYVKKVIKLHSGQFHLKKAIDGSTIAEILLPVKS